MKIQTGKLRHMLTIKTSTVEKNDDGESVASYEDLFQCRAFLENLQIVKKFESNGKVIDATARALVRWDARILGTILAPTQVQWEYLNFELITYTEVEMGISAYLWLKRIY